MMRQSLKDFLLTEKKELPEKWATLRPEQLVPEQFLELTHDIFGGVEDSTLAASVGISTDNEGIWSSVSGSAGDAVVAAGITQGSPRERYSSIPVWRTLKL